MPVIGQSLSDNLLDLSDRPLVQFQLVETGKGAFQKGPQGRQAARGQRETT